jgi:hypothetical protein
MQPLHDTTAAHHSDRVDQHTNSRIQRVSFRGRVAWKMQISVCMLPRYKLAKEPGPECHQECKSGLYILAGHTSISGSAYSSSSMSCRCLLDRQVLPVEPAT